MSAAKHFQEKRHAWAIDDLDGRLISASGDDLICDCVIKTRLYHTRREAAGVRSRLGFGRVVRVLVSYEVVE